MRCHAFQLPSILRPLSSSAPHLICQLPACAVLTVCSSRAVLRCKTCLVSRQHAHPACRQALSAVHKSARITCVQQAYALMFRLHLLVCSSVGRGGATWTGTAQGCSWLGRSNHCTAVSPGVCGTSLPKLQAPGIVSFLEAVNQTQWRWGQDWTVSCLTCVSMPPVAAACHAAQPAWHLPT